MVPFRVLSRQYLAYFPHHPSLNSRRFNLLQPLGRLEKSQLLCYQANPASFCKTPGVGGTCTRLPFRISNIQPLFPRPVATERSESSFDSASHSLWHSNLLVYPPWRAPC